MLHFDLNSYGKRMKDWSVFLELVLPPHTFEYFELSEAKVKEGKEKYMGMYGFDDIYTITFQEKDIIPEVIKKAANGKRVRIKGYTVCQTSRYEGEKRCWCIESGNGR